MSQEYDCFGGLNNYLEDDLPEDSFTDSGPNTSQCNSSGVLLDSPVPSPQPVTKTTSSLDEVEITSPSNSFNLSDIEKLQLEYENLAGVSNKRSRKSKESSPASSTKTTPKRMTVAALKKAELAKQKLLDELEKPPVTVTAKTSTSVAGKKRKSPQKKAGKSPRGDRPASNRVQALLNSMFGVSDTSEPSSSSTGQTRRRRKRGTDANVELIDLVSSPVLILPGVVSLDSDDENNEPKAKKSYALSGDLSFEAENYEVIVKIKWNGKVIRESMRKYQKFEDLLQKLAERENASPSSIVLNLDDRIIEPSDTVDTIGYTVSTFLSGRILSNVIASSPPKAKKKKDNNVIKLKIQIEGVKKTLLIVVNKTQPMRVAFVKLAEELKCKPEEIRLKFDGDKIELNSTPTELEFEGGEILDCRVIK